MQDPLGNQQQNTNTSPPVSEPPTQTPPNAPTLTPVPPPTTTITNEPPPSGPEALRASGLQPPPQMVTEPVTSQVEPSQTPVQPPSTPPPTQLPTQEPVSSTGGPLPPSSPDTFTVPAAPSPPPKKTRKTILTLLIFFVLLLGLGAGLILIKEQQDIRQRAAIITQGGDAGSGFNYGWDGNCYTNVSGCTVTRYTCPGATENDPEWLNGCNSNPEPGQTCFIADFCGIQQIDVNCQQNDNFCSDQGASCVWPNCNDAQTCNPTGFRTYDSFQSKVISGADCQAPPPPPGDCGAPCTGDPNNPNECLPDLSCAPGDPGQRVCWGARCGGPQPSATPGPCTTPGSILGRVWNGARADPTKQATKCPGCTYSEAQCTNAPELDKTVSVSGIGDFTTNICNGGGPFYGTAPLTAQQYTATINQTPGEIVEWTCYAEDFDGNAIPVNCVSGTSGTGTSVNVSVTDCSYNHVHFYFSQAAATPIPSPTPGPTAQCDAINVYRVTGDVGDPASWLLLSPADLTTLQPGETIYATTLGSNTTFERARIGINSGVWTAGDETTLIKPKANPTDADEFYITYSIPTGTTTFTFESELCDEVAGVCQWY